MKYNKYLFHCSSLTKLMTDGKEENQLSETTKTELERIWIEEEYKRKKDITTKMMEKGTLCEQETINLLNKKLHKNLVKNPYEYSDSHIIGTPDLIEKTSITDIKTSWDIWTFMQSDEKKAKKTYYYQLLGYMYLTGTRTSYLVYGLVNTPEAFIRDEVYRMSFQLNPESTQGKKQEAQITLNMTYDDIPESKRIKIYRFDFDNNLFKLLIKRVSMWRSYMNRLTL